MTSVLPDDPAADAPQLALRTQLRYYEGGMRSSLAVFFPASPKLCTATVAPTVPKLPNMHPGDTCSYDIHKDLLLLERHQHCPPKEPNLIISICPSSISTAEDAVFLTRTYSICI